VAEIKPSKITQRGDLSENLGTTLLQFLQGIPHVCTPGPSVFDTLGPGGDLSDKSVTIFVGWAPLFLRVESDTTTCLRVLLQKGL
jgi:hypothetical protein